MGRMDGMEPMLSHSDSRSCLISLHGSGNALAALAAVRHFGDSNGLGSPSRVVTIVHAPTDDREAAAEVGSMVERLIASQGWPAPIVMTIADVLALTPEGGRSYRRSLAEFRKLVGPDPFDEVYYAHDFVNRVPELMMNAFPQAERITFGDSLGFVFNGRYLVAQVLGASREEARASVEQAARDDSPGLTRRAMRWVRRRLLVEPRPCQARFAALILPMDHTGDYLNDKELLVVPRALTLEVIAECEATLPDVRQYSHELLGRSASPRYLLVLENDVESNTMSFDEAVRMYETAVRRNAPVGATVFIKPHPLAVEPTADEIARHLDPDYATTVLSPELMRCPLELWKTLLDGCEVITPLSSCYITLSYLYHKDVILASGRAWIEEFYPLKTWDYLTEVDGRYREMVSAMATWDGKSVLWSGSLT